jgi:DegV family protein with EDD domain
VNGRTRIITDSTCCLPSDVLDEYGISVVPVGLVIDGQLHRDGIDITLDDLCSRIETLEKQPTTSAVSPGDFVSVFAELADSTDSILCILVSKALTATHESAYLARRMTRPQHPAVHIEVVDSRTSAGALGFVVLEAARAAAEGKSPEEVVAVARDMISRVYYLAALDTLKYLINMGRAPRSGNVGEMLGVKPIIGFVDDTGLTEVVARVRGRHRSIAKVVDLVDRYVDADRPIHLMVHYSNGTADAEQLMTMIKQRYTCVESYSTPYSAAMVSATGPMVGVSFYQ